MLKIPAVPVVYRMQKRLALLQAMTSTGFLLFAGSILGLWALEAVGVLARHQIDHTATAGLLGWMGTGAAALLFVAQRWCAPRARAATAFEMRAVERACRAHPAAALLVAGLAGSGRGLTQMEARAICRQFPARRHQRPF